LGLSLRRDPAIIMLSDLRLNPLFVLRILIADSEDKRLLSGYKVPLIIFYYESVFYFLGPAIFLSAFQPHYVIFLLSPLTYLPTGYMPKYFL